MIAVFTKDERHFRELEMTPSKMFVRISNIDKIRGVKFTGIIRTWHWWDSEEVQEAYDHLRARQPELFD